MAPIGGGQSKKLRLAQRVDVSAAIRIDSSSGWLGGVAACGLEPWQEPGYKLFNNFLDFPGVPDGE